MWSSTSSQTSISNFIAQTPKDHNNLKFNFNKNQTRNIRSNTINHPINNLNDQNHILQNNILQNNNPICIKSFKKFNQNNINNNSQNMNFNITLK